MHDLGWGGADGHMGSTVDAAAKLRRVRFLVTVVLIGTVAAIGFHYVQGYWFGRGYPRSTFLFSPIDHLSDWSLPYGGSQALLRGESVPPTYFPLAWLVYGVGAMLPRLLGLALIIIMFLGVLVRLLSKWVVNLEESAFVRLKYWFILVALSYPVLFVIDRGNFEMVVFVLLAGFLYFLYVRERGWLAALFLAAAIACKIFPATFLLLLAAERRLKLCALTIFFAVAFTVAGIGFMMLAGGHDLGTLWQLSSESTAVYQHYMVMEGQGVQHGHTLWGIARVVSIVVGPRLSNLVAGHSELYIGLAAVIFVAIALHVVFRETERWKQVLLVTVAAILLPFVSADYTLIHMYFPLAFFVNSPRVSRYNMAYVALFAILLIPVDYYYFGGLGAVGDYGVSISVIIYPLALATLALLAVLDRPQVGDLQASRRSVGRGRQPRLGKTTGSAKYLHRTGWPARRWR